MRMAISVAAVAHVASASGAPIHWRARPTNRTVIDDDRGADDDRDLSGEVSERHLSCRR